MVTTTAVVVDMPHESQENPVGRNVKTRGFRNLPIELDVLKTSENLTSELPLEG